jgi:aspartate aminotransferase-like enzyme/beta-phosphoglucomutase-like phosphatase (HAD superfamily)
MTIAVLFDFNGVLVDDEDVHFEAFRRTSRVSGVTIDHEVYRRYLGFDDRGTIVALLAHYVVAGDVDDACAARRSREQAGATRSSRAGIRGSASGRARCCRRCAPRARGWRSCRARAARRSTPCSTRRRCATASTRRGGRGRHARQARSGRLRLARARLDAVAGAPLAAVAIEDAPAGLRAARDAGARCIGLATTCPAAELGRRRRDRAVARRRSDRRRRRARIARTRGGSASAARRPPILFTPGPVRVPPAVTRALVDPPCNYHRQEAFCALRADIEARHRRGYSGSASPPPYQAAVSPRPAPARTKPACWRWRAPGRAWVAANGFFAARLVEQAARNGIAHRVLEALPDRPLDPAEIDRALAAAPELRWLYVVSHETRAGLKNPLTEIGAVARRRGVAVAADVVSSAFAYPIDVEAAGLDLAVTSSSKAIGAVPGLGIVLVRAAFLERLRAARGAGYYLDLVAECDKQRRESQPRFAQPVALYAALAAACAHLRSVGVEAHMARMQRQMQAIVAHLEALGVPATLPAAYRSGVAVNFRLPAWLPYPTFARRVLQEGYYVLYGPPGDDGQFQVSTIGDLDDSHVAGLQAALTRVLDADEGLTALSGLHRRRRDEDGRGRGAGWSRSCSL